MSKKDYILIADILKTHNANQTMVATFAKELKEQNPKFDADKFVKYCLK
jgi:hypothetical protein